jgi:hypothetical protein
MSLAKETLNDLMTTLAVAAANRNEEEAIAAAGGIATLGMVQLIRIADAMEKLAGLMDVTVASVDVPARQQEAPPAPPAEPYARPDCVFHYCPEPEVCQADSRCHQPAGWGEAAGLTSPGGDATRPRARAHRAPLQGRGGALPSPIARACASRR